MRVACIDVIFLFSLKPRKQKLINTSCSQNYFRLTVRKETHRTTNPSIGSIQRLHMLCYDLKVTLIRWEPAFPNKLEARRL